MATKKRSKSKSETYAQYRKRILRVQKQIRSMSNPRKIKGKSTTLRNMAFVSITKQRNGVIKITGRKMAPKRNGPLSRLLRHPSRVKSEYGYQRAGGSSRRESLKRAVRTSAYNPRKRKGKR